MSMDRMIALLLLMFTFASCHSKEETKDDQADKSDSMDQIDEFKGYIVGDFTNQKQVEEQEKAGKRIHPYAEHVNRIADDKIRNKPDTLKGFFVLEESYYEEKGKERISKPYLFYFCPDQSGNVVLHSMQVPDYISKSSLYNANDTLVMDYQELMVSPNFKPSTYAKTEEGFYLKSVNDLPGGMRFTLEETIGPERLMVMELLEKDGKSLTPYDEPIIYDRIK